MPEKGSEKFVLDSHALLAYLEDEPGREKVEELLNLASKEEVELLLSVINLGEVLYITERERGLSKAHEVLARIEELPIAIIEVNRKLALEAAHYKALHPIAYADCFALALARLRGATLVTGDPEFEQIKPEYSPPIRWLR